MIKGVKNITSVLREGSTQFICKRNNQVLIIRPIQEMLTLFFHCNSLILILM